MSDRPPQLTPIVGGKAGAATVEAPPIPVDSSTDDASPHLPGLSTSQRFVRVAALVGGLATILATLYGGTHFVAVSAIDSAVPEKIAKESSARKEALAEEAKTREAADAKKVSEELYAEHVRQAERDRDEARAERKEILQKLDAIGRRTYSGERRWKRELADKEEE